MLEAPGKKLSFGKDGTAAATFHETRARMVSGPSPA